MKELYDTVTGWRKWKWLMPALVLFGILIWIFVNKIAWIDSIARLHDNFILPVILKLIYSQLPVLLLCMTGCIVILLLWPYGRVWPMAAVLCSWLFLGWVILYEMWRNAVFSTVFVAGFLLYVICRYGWVWLVRQVPLLGRQMYSSLLDYINLQKRCDVYYDAIRANVWPAVCKNDAGKRIWGRKGKPIESAKANFWINLFGPFSSTYRSGAKISLLCGRFINGRHVPASLEISWVSQILDRLAGQYYFDVSKYTVNSEQWLNIYEQLREVLEAKAEYICFSPETYSQRSLFLALIADLYDELSRIGLARQLWIDSNIEHGNVAHQNGVKSQRKRITDRRLDFIKQAVCFRELYFGLSEGVPEERIRETINILKTAGFGTEGVQALVLAMNYYQLGLLCDDPAPLSQAATNQLLDACREFFAKAPKTDKTPVLRKGVELGLDCSNQHWVQDLLAQGEISKADDSYGISQNNARLEGHLYWRIAKSVEDEDMKISAYRAAALAFYRGTCRELEELKKEILFLAKKSADKQRLHQEIF